ncbi:MAG: SpoIIE family protein phosphatase [Methanoregulaceae archaeon]
MLTTMDDPLPPPGKKRLRLRVATKLMIAFLILSVASFGAIGFFAISSMEGLRDIAIANSVSLGETASADSTAALSALGESAIREKALDVAEQVKIYLAAHPGIPGEDLGGMPDLERIAVQGVGDTGYTCVYEKGTALMRLHPNPELVNYDMQNLRETLPSWWTIFEPSLTGAISGGYYDWKEPDGSIRQKFMYMVPVEGTPYMAAATTYIDEFLGPVEATRLTIAAETEATAATIDDQIGRAITLFLAIFLAMLIAVGGLVFLLSRMITDPIRELSRGAEAIGSGGLDYHVQVHSGDEFEQLADAFNRMTGDLQRYMHELIQTTAEKERIEKELEIARGIQQSFLPESAPEIPGIDIAGMTLPAREVGGDFYDYIPVGGGRWGLVIADVSGKGVPAALFMGLSRTLVRANAMAQSSVSETLVRANELITENERSSMFVTVFYGVLDPARRSLAYASAGHNAPFMIRSGGVETIVLKAEGIALGVVREIDLEEREITLDPGDILVLYTDGVTEAVNPLDEEFGVARLTATVERHRDAPSSAIIERVRDEVIRYSQGQPQFDDITLIVVKVL